MNRNNRALLLAENEKKLQAAFSDFDRANGQLRAIGEALDKMAGPVPSDMSLADRVFDVLQRNQALLHEAKMMNKAATAKPKKAPAPKERGHSGQGTVGRKRSWLSKDK